MNRRCYCDSGKDFSSCCEPLLLGKIEAGSALELMRSRFSAYATNNGEYIYKTCSSKLKNIEDIEAINKDDTQWLSLKVQGFSENTVSFMAYYKDNNQILVFSEDSIFVMEDGQFRYDSGEVKEGEVQRNEACPCLSGKKYKKCCGKSSV